MTTARLTPWLIASALALVLATAHHLDDGIPDHHAEWDQAQNIDAALRAADERRRFERAAQALCGPQAAWQELADGAVQCRTKHGRPTITARVAP